MAKSVYIFIPAFGNMLTAATFSTSHNLRNHLQAKGIGGSISVYSYPDIAELRSIALTRWYDTTDEDYLLFIDADMGFPPALVTDMLMLDEPLVGAIYPKRGLPINWVGSCAATSAERRGDFIQVDGIGMGVTLIRRDVVDVMLEQMPDLVDTRLELHPAGIALKEAGATRIIRAFEKVDIPEAGPLSEDLSFCWRWKQCGGRIWASIGHPITHVGQHEYTGCYLDVAPMQEVANAA